MAKKKNRKETKKKDTGYHVELVGIFLILISIIGFIPNTGMIGNFIGSFAGFLVGTWYNVLLGIVMIIGIYMMVKRAKPDFFTSKLIGFYIVCVAILVFSHIKYIQDKDLKGFDIVTQTVNNLMQSGNNQINLGGGMIGALFSLLFSYLLDIKGTQIAMWALLICGTIMFTGISIYDAVKWILSKMKRKTPREKKVKKESEKPEAPIITAPEEKDNRIVVSSVDQLIHINEDKVPVKEEPPAPKIMVNESTGEVIEENNKNYSYPPLSLLNPPKKNKGSEDKATINHNVEVLQQVFQDFGIVGRVVAIHPGPTVTQYEMETKSGTKVSKILNIHREIALALAAKDVRIQAPIPGKSTIGIEIPNKVTAMVTVREILEQVPPNKKDSKLLVALGRDILGRPVFCEIDKTPHLLVAGSTGSGKSVCINSIIVSILMRTKPDEVKLVLVDPKKVEFSMYNGVPHLLVPVVTEPKKANIALKKIVVEMEKRYDLFSESGTKNIAGYNEMIDKKNTSLPEGEKLRRMPYIVAIIDELADLMLVAAKEVEDSIMRITQMARAAGIHLIVATQRPSTDVITGVVKSNIPSRIAFAVASGIDSRTILDHPGAERLLGKGDMLFALQGETSPTRVQGAFLSDDEIKSVADYAIKQQIAHYDETLLMDEDEMNATTMVNDGKNRDADEEPLYNEIVEFVVTQGKASASLLQRRFRLGYNRAARAIDLLEERGIIGPSNGSKPRDVLVKLEGEDE